MDSLIPILFNISGDAQVAVDRAISLLDVQVRSFDCAAQRLVHQSKADDTLLKDLMSFVTQCRLYCTGNLEWR